MDRAVANILDRLDFTRITGLDNTKTEQQPRTLGVWCKKRDKSIREWVLAVWTRDGDLWVAIHGGESWYGDFNHAASVVAPEGPQEFYVPPLGKMLVRQLEARAHDPNWEPSLVM